jgi:hypothetical protein
MCWFDRPHVQHPAGAEARGGGRGDGASPATVRSALPAELRQPLRRFPGSRLVRVCSLICEAVQLTNKSLPRGAEIRVVDARFAENCFVYITIFVIFIAMLTPLPNLLKHKISIET